VNFFFKTNGYRLKVGIYNELTSKLNPVDFIRVDFLIPTPYQLSGSSSPVYENIQSLGNRTAAPPTKFVINSDWGCHYNNNTFENIYSNSLIKKKKVLPFELLRFVIITGMIRVVARFVCRKIRAMVIIRVIRIRALKFAYRDTQAHSVKYPIWVWSDVQCNKACLDLDIFFVCLFVASAFGKYAQTFFKKKLIKRK
jgi:hypothetical protein